MYALINFPDEAAYPMPATAAGAVPVIVPMAHVRMNSCARAAGSAQLAKEPSLVASQLTKASPIH